MHPCIPGTVGLFRLYYRRGRTHYRASDKDRTSWQGRCYPPIAAACSMAESPRCRAPTTARPNRVFQVRHWGVGVRAQPYVGVETSASARFLPCLPRG
jgi:hypothetical protein